VTVTKADERIQKLPEEDRGALAPLIEKVTECILFHYEVPNAMCGVELKKSMEQYQQCLDTICLPFSGNQLTVCKQIADDSIAGPKMVGIVAWKNSQKEQCDCVDEDQVLLRQRSTLKQFYKTYSPSNLHKVDSLMEKYSGRGPQQFGLVMLSLHRKFRDAVLMEKATPEELKQYLDENRRNSDEIRKAHKTGREEDKAKIKADADRQTQKAKATKLRQQKMAEEEDSKPVPTMDEL